MCIGRGGETPPLPSLGQVVGYFKYQTAKSINLARDTPGATFWRRNYYEHVIRNDRKFDRIREYVLANPFRWAFDRENPAGQPDRQERDFWASLA